MALVTLSILGDNRSVQGIFHDALQSMASPDKVVNGKNVSFMLMNKITLMCSHKDFENR